MFSAYPFCLNYVIRRLGKNIIYIYRHIYIWVLWYCLYAKDDRTESFMHKEIDRLPILLYYSFCNIFLLYIRHSKIFSIYTNAINILLKMKIPAYIYPIYNKHLRLRLLKTLFNVLLQCWMKQKEFITCTIIYYFLFITQEAILDLFLTNNC